MDKIFKSKTLAYIAAFGVIVLGNLSASALNGDPLYKWLPGGEENPYGLITGPLTLLLLIWSMWHLYMHRSVFQSIRMMTQRDATDLHTGIILLLSPPNQGNFKNESVIITKGSETFSLPSDNNRSANTMKNDIELLQGTRWTWQQMLRGICYHYDSVNYVYIVSSKSTYKTHNNEKILDQKGSFDNCTHAAMLLKAYKVGLEVETHERAVDFEDFNELRFALEAAIKWMKDKKKIKDKDIVIDITGGMKISSATGAMVTLDNNITFQCVQTGGDNKVISFDVISQAPASPM